MSVFFFNIPVSPVLVMFSFNIPKVKVDNTKLENRNVVDAGEIKKMLLE